MRRAPVWMATLTAGILALGAAAALAAGETSKSTEVTKPAGSYSEKAEKAEKTEQKAEVRRVRGEVTAVEPGAKTMVVKTYNAKKEEMTVGVDVTDKTVIREKKAHKTLADIKVGDKVWMKYEEYGDKFVAEVIRILKPGHVAAK